MTLPDKNRVVSGSDGMGRQRHIPRTNGAIPYCCNIGSHTSLCRFFVLTTVVLFLLLFRSNIDSPATRHLESFHYSQLRRERPHHHRVLLQVQEAAAVKAKEDPYSYATADISKILVDDEEGDGDDITADPNKPYTLGPKISDWDQQRGQWLQQNPSFPNFIKPNKPRVLLVTGSSPKPCENPLGDHYLLKSVKNKIDYCRLHKIGLFYNMALLDAEMNGFWAKLPLIRKLLLSHPEVELLWWMDSDAMFTDMVFEVPWERYKDHNVVFHGWKEMVYDMKNWVGLNTGSFLLRNCQWSLDLLESWATMGPETVRTEAGKLLTRELMDRPAFEADDQSAMVYLLATERDKWGDKVYLENAYNLHGYWAVLVDKYEEMIEKYHPGLGDQRWPLITHFVGCKPCGKIGKSQEFERCVMQMDRAFHFGDNQILQMYGYTHESLGSSRVKITQNETGNPHEFRDELIGLLHTALIKED